MSRRLAAVLILASLAHATAALIPPNDPRLSYLGRVDASQSGQVLFSWSGSGVSFALNGDEALVRLAGAPVRFGIRINGRDVGVETIRGGTDGVRIQVPANEKRPALVEMVRLNQPLFGVSEFRGIETNFDLATPAPRPDRLIEFIGDSITAGHGNEAAGPSSPLEPGTEDVRTTYAGLTAKAFGADASVLAWSGIRLTKGKPDEITMPVRWPRTLPDRKRPVWNFERKPNVVVVNLGTNDFTRDQPGEDVWKSSLREFLTAIREKYPESLLIFTNGPMLNGKSFEQLQSWSNDVVTEMKTAGDSRLATFFFSPQKVSDGIGGQWHPSLRTHAIMARDLTDFIKGLTGWTPADIEIPPVTQSTSG